MLKLLSLHCSYGLEKEFRDDLYGDFEQHTLDFYKKGNLYGLEKYWYVCPHCIFFIYLATPFSLCQSKLMYKLFYNVVRAFHHYREARDNNEPLNKNPELDKLLREEFRNLDDFRRAKEKSKVKDDNKPLPA